MTLLVRRRKPFFYFMPGYPGASRAFAIRKLLIAAACDTGIPVSQAAATSAPSTRNQLVQTEIAETTQYSDIVVREWHCITGT